MTRSAVGQRWVGAMALVAGVLAVPALAPRAAQACGGLFCSSAQPVNQAAERIIFSFDKTKKQVTAVVEILYQGPAEKFAWLLPVPGVPTVGVSTSAALDRLQAATNPLYSLNRVWKSSVCGGNPSAPGAFGSGGSAGSAGPTDDKGSGVSVLASGSVGPYEFDVIMVDPDPAVTDKAMVAIKWLTDKGYDVGALGREVLQPYLRDGLNLIAFKLQKNKTAGSIRPVMLTYNTDHPMIPIVPTAVAANPDMGILVFVLGDRRAVPVNYKSLELNEALINWFTPNMTYNAVVTAAADEAKGQGFVTELAQPTATGSYSQVVYQEQFIVAEYRRTADSLNNLALLTTIIERFASVSPTAFMGPFASRPGGMRVALDGVTDVLQKYLTLPAGVTIDQVMMRPRCYLTPPVAGAVYCEGSVAPPAEQRIDLTTFDRVKFMLDVEALVIKPLEDTARLFAEQAYLTRLYTTLSPAEMTLDPTFDLATGLPDVSNVHTATLTYDNKNCGDTTGSWSADIGGLIVRGADNVWPHDATGAVRMPFNRRIVQMTSNQPPQVETDNTVVIARVLGGAQPAAVGAGGDDDGGGCAKVGRSSAGMLSLIAFAGLAALALRRRRDEGENQ